MDSKIIWTFETDNLRVTLAIAPDDDLDLSWWDDDVSTREGLESGKYIAFIAGVRIVHKKTGTELGVEYIGGCVYESVEQFRREKGYLVDMVYECIRQARKNIAALKAFPLRVVA